MKSHVAIICFASLLLWCVVLLSLYFTAVASASLIGFITVIWLLVTAGIIAAQLRCFDDSSEL